MNFLSFFNMKYQLGQYIINIPGWRTKRKIVVFESDDWGSERTPSKETFDILLKNNLRVDLCPYSQFDRLESETDLKMLFDLLSRFKDQNNRHPVFTANFNLANPDFVKIKESDFNKYYYLNLEETIKQKYPDSSNNIEIIKNGINDGVFKPQYHHRDHLSTHLWLEQIRNGNKALQIGFNMGVFGLGRITSPAIQKYHLAGLFYRNQKERQEVLEANKIGIEFFKNYFGYKPESFIAPVYVWNSEFEKNLSDNGLKFIQGMWFQTGLKDDAITNKRKKFHYTGERNKYNQIFTVRNCSFEPSLVSGINHVDNCMKKIEFAFNHNKPAIISSHRVNYIGSLHSSNRNSNLRLLELLLTSIISKFPDVEFMSNDELGNLILNEKNEIFSTED